MTTAPQCLRDARALLLRHLDVHDGSSAYPADLDPAEVGIVGDSAHRGGYHCGRDRLDPTRDYSVVESARDRDGLTYDSCALDVGQFTVRVAGKTHDLRSFSVWCVAQCKAGAPDSRDIREIIYSPDGQVVRRWDRLGRRTTGDDSHLWHTHYSVHRDAIKAGRGLAPLFKRYLTEIGLIEGDDMFSDEDRAALKRIEWAIGRGVPLEGGTGNEAITWAWSRLVARLDAVLAAVQGADTDAILAEIRQHAQAEAQRDADLRALVEQGQSGELAAAEVVRLIGERLAPTQPAG